MRRSFGFALLVLLVLVVFQLSATAVLAASAGQIAEKLAKEKSEAKQPIEFPEALDSFYASLARTAAQTPGAITRISHFGDSLIEMDLLSGQARRRLQAKWGDSGHGFALVSPSKPWYRPYDLTYKSDLKWLGYDMTMEDVRDRRFGLGGSLAVSYKAKAKTLVGTAKQSNIGQNVSSLEIQFPIEPSGGEVEVRVDGKKVGVLNTAGPAFAEAYTKIEVPDGAHRFEITALKEKIRLYGLVLERDTPGVVYDSLGLNGTGASTYQKIDTAHWAAQLQHRNPNLVILGFGTNEAAPGLDASRYQKQVESVILKVKSALPNCSVLVMAPMDKATKKGTSLVSNPLIGKIVQAQRDAAKSTGAAFWSTYDAMGGEGSMAKWYGASPRLGAGDLMHPTPKGGEVLGNLFYNALMKKFAGYLNRKGMPGPAPAPPADPLKKVNLQ